MFVSLCNKFPDMGFVILSLAFHLLFQWKEIDSDWRYEPVHILVQNTHSPSRCPTFRTTHFLTFQFRLKSTNVVISINILTDCDCGVIDTAEVVIEASDNVWIICH